MESLKERTDMVHGPHTQLHKHVAVIAVVGQKDCKHSLECGHPVIFGIIMITNVR